jgi:tRNA A-37 threonylcarbamoyl transferase component Bud32
LRELVENLSKQGVYIGDLNSKNLIWSKDQWVIVDSGGIKEGVPYEETLATYLDKIHARWSKQVQDPKCAAMFRTILQVSPNK